MTNIKISFCALSAWFAMLRDCRRLSFVSWAAQEWLIIFLLTSIFQFSLFLLDIMPLCLYVSTPILLHCLSIADSIYNDQLITLLRGINKMDKQQCQVKWERTKYRDVKKNRNHSEFFAFYIHRLRKKEREKKQSMFNNTKKRNNGWTEVEPLLKWFFITFTNIYVCAHTRKQNNHFENKKSNA